MNCLVLGGGGFIGSHLCDRLIIDGHKVRIFEKLDFSQNNLKYFNGEIDLINGDFANSQHLKDAVADIDVIFHLISTTLPKSSNYDPVGDVSDNVIPSIKLLDEALKAGVKKVIYISSGGTVYGIPRYVPIDESHPTEPVCSYGIQKLMIEKYLGLYHKLHKLDYTVLRFSNPFGEWQNHIGSQGAVTIFVYKALKGEPIEIWGDGTVVRDYLYIGDAIDAAIKAVEISNETKLFNIGSGIGLSLNDVVAGIGSIIGSKIDVHYSDARNFDVPVNILDISRAKKILRWQPRMEFMTGLERTICYFKALNGN